ncbi:MAG: peptidase S41 [Gammaproteobacteria bacterium]|nr:peptidase S41 [Gammaproteobacteria bacterium]
MSRLPVTATGILCTLLAACGGSEDGASAGGCGNTAKMRFVRDTAREWYLFDDLLPANVDFADYADATELLDALTAEARAQGKDRYFSYLTTRQADDSILQEGEFIGFGLRTRIAGDRLWLTDVFEDSPAEEAGLARGTEIIAIDSGSGFVPIATILAQDPELEEAFGPAVEGTERGLRFVPLGGSATEAVFTKRVVTITPLAQGGPAILALPANPAVPVGYLSLRAFISTAETPLRDAYAEFRAQGIDYFIVDLRYNGGGLVSIAELIGDLNGAARDDSDLYFEMRFNDRKSSGNNVRRRFDPQPQSVAPVRIAFITTGLSASASELVVNSLAPWIEVAIVGDDTFGKPVGQSAFDLSGCDTRLRLVTFQFTNADGQGGYYEGLASLLPFACRAEDDLAYPPGAPAEPSTAEALAWLGTGACTDTLTAWTGKLREELAWRVPRLRKPASAQVYLPGLY